MITISIVLNTIGGFVLYLISQKKNTEVFPSFIQQYIEHKKGAKIASILIMCIAFVLNIISFGVVSGMLFWLFLLSIVLCLIIVLTPLKIINYKWIVSFFVLCLIVEIFFS